jgi:hypothetical protein
MKEYKFNTVDLNIVIIIKAYNLEDAYNKLVITTKHPSDFINVVYNI